MIVDDYLDYSKTYKEKYGQACIVLMQVGSFYEMYSVKDDTSEDIYTIADICNIQISRKNKSIQEVSHQNPLMAGFPLGTLRKYTTMLLNHNYTIVLIEQVTEPPNPERKITEILSPGMNIHISSKKNNYMMVLYYEFADDLPIVGVAGIDLSTGSSFVYEAGANKNDPEFVNDEVFRLLATYNPCEIVVLSDKKYDDSKKAYLLRGLNLTNVLTHLKWETYEYIKSMSKLSYQNVILEKAFADKKKPNMLSITESLDLEKYNVGRVALCCLLQFAYEHNADIIYQLNIPEIINDHKHLVIEFNSAVQLNVIGLYPNDRPLISILNRCQTAFGSRLFKERLLKPVIDKNVLNARYDMIDSLVCDQKYQQVSKYLGHILDLERIKRKMTMGKFHPQDWYGFNVSMENAVEVLKLMAGGDGKGHVGWGENEYKDIIAYYSDIIDVNEATKYNLNDIKGNIFLRGVYSDLDNYVTEFEEAYERITAIVHKINNLDTTGDSTACKLEYTDRDGYYISMTNRRYDSAKAKDATFMQQFQKKAAGSSSNVKLVCEQMIAASACMDQKQGILSKLVAEYYQNFVAEFIGRYSEALDHLIHVIGDIDIACCNAKNAFEYRYYRPVIDDYGCGCGRRRGRAQDCTSGSFIDAKNIRHPIIERIDDSVPYIGNDIRLGACHGACACTGCNGCNACGMLLYGINAAGKSSLMKSVGVNIIMAQAGMYVAAEEFRFKPYKHIFTRISGMDNIYKGMSTFVVEMTELRNILQRCDNNSLVLGDEICSGTEATSGLAIVASGINTLVDKGASFIFATHLHQLPDIEIVQKHINSGKIGVSHIHITIDDKNRIRYERKLREGRGMSTYGIEVCRSLDMPAGFMQIAESVRKQIEGYDQLFVQPDGSRYNKDVYITKCSICDQMAEDTHHIQYQCQSDKDGYFRDYHQNMKHNLMPLCKECHQKEHSGQIDIKGYVKTSEGLVVDLMVNPPQQMEDNCGIVQVSDYYERLRDYVRRGKCHWYIRSARTKTYKKCSDVVKILSKINKLLPDGAVVRTLEDADLFNRLYDPLL
jgi:DNA mismatch repair protein MutS